MNPNILCMNRKCHLIDSRVVAITATRVEDNLVTINPRHQAYANPRYRVAILIELEECSKRPWDTGQYHVYLLFNGLLFSLFERGEPTKTSNQTFKFELVDEVTPQVERIIDLAVDKAL
jgi:hypothetical protein